MTQKASLLRQILSTHDWNILSIADGSEHAGVESFWIIESVKENRGFQLCLWFQKYNPDAIDGYDCVTATDATDSPPDPYSGLPKIDFSARKFEKQLEPFLESIHHLRCTGSANRSSQKTDQPCPKCGQNLRSPKAQQCLHCGCDWHTQS